MYITNFFKDRKVGAVAPSSPFCVKKVSQKIDYKGKKVFVEYGSGAGEFTRHFLKRMDDDAVILALETNEYYIDKLKEINDDRLIVVHDKAENVKQILLDNNLDKVDYIISGIPFTLHPKETRIQIVEDSTNVLKEDGAFIIYQYSTYVKRFLKNHFVDISTDFTIFNLPPMFVMKASGKLNGHSPSNGKSKLSTAGNGQVN